MAQVIAAVLTDLTQSRLGLPGLSTYHLAGKSILQRTVDRLSRVEGISQIVLIHPPGQNPMEHVTPSAQKPVVCYEHNNAAGDAFTPMRRSARKWAMNAWRGGLGTATCYDELLPARPIHEAMCAHQADAVLLVGGDWALVDPALCNQVIDAHVQYPEAMQFTFTQAPPGLAGVTLGRALIEQLVGEPSSSLGSLLGYVPSRPQADPIGKDVCMQIPASVRRCAKRFIFDNQRSVELIEALNVDYDDADCVAITDTAARISAELNQPPQQVRIELPTARLVDGPLVTKPADDTPLPLEQAKQMIDAICLVSMGDTVLTLGGAGDAILYDDWQAVVRYAAGQGVFGICLETDMLIEPDALDALFESPIDVISIRLNADTNATYEAVMQPTIPDAFKRVTSNIQWLLNERNRRWQAADAPADSAPGVPWIVPRLIKTSDTLKDMETFFDRWMHYAGHAVIEPPMDQTYPEGVYVPPKHTMPRALVTSAGKLQEES